MANDTQTLDKDKILNTQARRIVFDCVMQGLNLKEAAKQANLGHGYVKKWVSTSNFYSLLNQENAIIAEKTGITVGNLQQKYLQIASMAIEKGHLGVAKGAYDSLMKSIGGFQADRPNEETIKRRKLAEKQEKELREMLSAHIARKYLASEVIDSADNYHNVLKTDDSDGNIDGDTSLSGQK